MCRGLANATHFLWGLAEGGGYHALNIATSTFGMKDLSAKPWQPQSLLASSDYLVQSSGMALFEQSALPFTYEARRLLNPIRELSL